MARAPRIPKTGLPPARVKGPRPGDSAAHLRFLKTLPCIVSVAHGANPYEMPGADDPHHLLGATDGLPKGGGRTNADRYAIPVTRAAHEWLHRAGDDEAALASIGVDGRAAADFFWRHTGEADACLAYMAKHIMGAAKRVGRAA